jgi:hypothetical protein
MPLLESLLPALETTIPTVITTITVTAQATAPMWLDTLGPVLGDTLPLATMTALPQKTPLDNRNLNRFQKAQQKAQNNLNNKDCQSFLQAHGIDPSAVRNAIGNEVPWNGIKSSISQLAAAVFDPQDPSNFTPFAQDLLKEAQ